jgi:hypothetical protein
MKHELWKCPKCGHSFVTRNLWHSCVRVRLTDHFKGRPAVLRKTWNEWVATARACGPVTAYAQKTRLVIQARVRFAGAVVRVGYLDAGLWLHRRVEHPRLRRVEDFGSLGFVHHFRLEQPADIDGSLKELVLEAYQAAVHGRNA